MRLNFSLVLLLVVILNVSAEPIGMQSGHGDAVYAHAQRLVKIGNGRRMNLFCIGIGSPTVIFDSGLSDWGFTWALVQPRIARITKTCVYDRAGLGYSDVSNRPSTSENMVDDLYRLLMAASIAPPYLLVGHSLGGMNVRLYADRFLNDVVGMVLVDPVHEDGMARMDAVTNGRETRRYAEYLKNWQVCTAASGRFAIGSDMFKRCVDGPVSQYSDVLNAARIAVEMQPSFQKAQLSETENYLNGFSSNNIRAARRSYGAMPLVVLTSGQRLAEMGPEWLKLHKELAALSTMGKQRTVDGASHYIQLDQPDAVIDAIAEVFAQSRASKQ